MGKWQFSALPCMEHFAGWLAQGKGPVPSRPRGTFLGNSGAFIGCNPVAPDKRGNSPANNPNISVLQEQRRCAIESARSLDAMLAHVTPEVGLGYPFL